MDELRFDGRLLGDALDVRTMSPAALAFLGDGVYGLMVRELLLSRANRPAGVLHKLSVSMVRAEAQSAAVDAILPLLSEGELAVYKRGRNTHTARTGGDYHRATGLETLFGYLYLNGELERLRELFEVCVPEVIV